MIYHTLKNNYNLYKFITHQITATINIFYRSPQNIK